MATIKSTRYLYFSVFFFMMCGFFSFAVSYFPLYCKWISFTPFQLAAVGIVWNLGNIVGPPFVMFIVHHFCPARIALRCLFLVLFLTLPLLYLTFDFLVIILLWIVIIVSLRSGCTLVEAQVMQDVNRKKLVLEYTRVWGSIGFIVLVFLTGWLFDLYGEGSILPIGIANALLLLLAAWLASNFLRRETGSRSQHQECTTEATMPGAWTAFWLMILTVMLVNAGHSVYYVYFSVYLRALNYSGMFISLAWNLGVIAEIILFFIVPRFRRQISLVTLLRISILGAILRWTLLFVSKDPTVILLSQCLHALSFGGIFLATIELTFSILPKHFRDRGQGYRAAIGYGVGALLGSFLAGVGADALNSLKDLNLVFGGAAGLTVIALIVSFWIPKDSVAAVDNEELIQSLSSAGNNPRDIF